MSDSHNKADGDSAAGTPPPAANNVPAESVYLYAAAGLGERKGHVPIWLWLVVFALSVWGIYYLVTYWNPPAGSG
jgi:hypothetical protein